MAVVSLEKKKLMVPPSFDDKCDVVRWKAKKKKDGRIRLFEVYAPPSTWIVCF